LTYGFSTARYTWASWMADRFTVIVLLDFDSVAGSEPLLGLLVKLRVEVAQKTVMALTAKKHMSTYFIHSSFLRVMAIIF